MTCSRALDRPYSRLLEDKNFHRILAALLLSYSIGSQEPCFIPCHYITSGMASQADNAYLLLKLFPSREATLPYFTSMTEHLRQFEYIVKK
jgi:hypothetical protein